MLSMLSELILLLFTFKSLIRFEIIFTFLAAYTFIFLSMSILDLPLLQDVWPWPRSNLALAFTCCL